MFGIESCLKLFGSLALNIGFGFLGLYSAGYFLAKKMEIQINSKKKNPFIVGLFGLLVILLIGTFAGSTVGFLLEGVTNLGQYYKFNDALFDYYVKPFFWILLFGIIPTIIMGLTLGKLIANLR